MANRLCLDCGTVTTQSRCAECRSRRERDRDQRRGSRQARGYGAEYDAASNDRAYLTATRCAACGGPFTPNNPKTKGHARALRRGGGHRIVAHCRRCNYGWRKTGL